MSGESGDDPVAAVDALVAAAGPGLDPPAIQRCDVVLVTGPWMAGVSAVADALRDRLPQHKFVESADLGPGEVPMMRKVRFRTLGCYPLTGAVESEADTLPAIIREMLLARTSERQGRVIDHDAAASMEKKKQEGYF